MKRLDGKGIRFVVDTTGDTLLTALKHKPFLVKPNHLELGEIFNSDIDNGYDAMTYGKKLSEMGAQNTIVSMGENGAVLINAKGVPYRCRGGNGDCQQQLDRNKRKSKRAA